MAAIYKVFIFCCLLPGFAITRLAAQETPGVGTRADSITFKSRRLVIPAVLVAYTAATFTIPAFKEISNSTRNEIIEDRPWRTRLDDYTQYAPAALFYTLNLAGRRSAHNVAYGTKVYAVAMALTACVVVPAKHLVAEERPDQSNHRSFPSGHTATAFAAAQFFFREYVDISIPLALSGYVFAGFTGIYRTINNKHWVHDVTAGAAVGMLATEGAYLLYPVIERCLKGKKGNLTILPMLSGNTILVAAKLQL